MSMFLLYHIGCIECGVPSFPIGKYNSIEAATEAARQVPDSWQLHGGESELVILDLDTLQQRKLVDSV
jgi:hypothetical protein